MKIHYKDSLNFMKRYFLSMIKLHNVEIMNIYINFINLSKVLQIILILDAFE